MEKVFDGRLIKVYTKDVLLPNGKVKKYEMLNHPGAAAVLAFYENKIVLVRQKRVPFEEDIFEIPAGKMEKGEDPLSTAKRELAEETGLYTDNFIFLGEMYPSVGYTNEVIYLYLAKDLKKGETNPDDDEFLDIIYMDKNDFHEAVMNNEIKDAKTLVAYLKYCSLK